jgi:menaquinone-dependent protoporphyrinogen oxidase
MNILIAVASRHGSTQEIAEAIAQELRAARHTVQVEKTGEVDDITGYAAVIVGSAVYMGDWLPEARQFVERHQTELAARPVWLFSSGPLGQEHPRPEGDPAHLAALMQDTGAQGHRIFVGKLDRSDLGLAERLITKAIKPPEGDFRDWPAIRAWAQEIAAALPVAAAATG